MKTHKAEGKWYNQKVSIATSFVTALITACVTIFLGGFLHDGILSSSLGAANAIPQQADVHLAQGSELFGQSKYALAIVEFTEAIALNPLLSDAYYLRGYSYMLEKEHVDAIADLTVAIHLNEDNSNAHLALARAYFSQEKYAQAIDQYTQAIYLNRADSFAYWNRADAYYAIGDLYAASADRQTAKDLGFINDPQADTLIDVHAGG